MAVRIPMPVEAAEAGCRQRFVHRRKFDDPGIPASDRACEPRQLVGKTGIKKRGIRGSAAVIQEAGDGPHIQLAQPREPLVRPAPVEMVDALRSDAFPQHRVAQGANAERREGGEVVDPRIVSRPDELIKKLVADAVHRAFDAPPDLERCERAAHAAVTVVRPRAPTSFADSVRACATTWSML